MTTLTDQEIERRLPVWVTLADLFAANDPDDDDMRCIAERLVESTFSNAELETILLNEVAPVFLTNLHPLNPVPEILGFSAESVKKLVLAKLNSGPSWNERILSKVGLQNWQLGDALSLVRKRWQNVVAEINKNATT